MCNKKYNYLEIPSIRSSLDLGNKIWIEKPFIDSFSLQKPPPRFFIFATSKLWHYLVQVFLVGLSFFLLSDYASLMVSQLHKKEDNCINLNSDHKLEVTPEPCKVLISYKIYDLKWALFYYTIHFQIFT